MRWPDNGSKGSRRRIAEIADAPDPADDKLERLILA